MALNIDKIMREVFNSVLISNPKKIGVSYTMSLVFGTGS